MNNTISLASYSALTHLHRAFGFPRLLPANYTFSLSPRCNSRCKTCNIWKKTAHELSLEEWEKVCKSIGRSPYWITISGGEPFLSKDIVPLCGLIAKYCKPAIINIPTNSLVKTVPERVAQIAESIKPAQLIINLSLDGVGKKHDEIRGIPGNFVKFETTLRELQKVQTEHDNLSIGVHTVVSSFNVDDIDEILAYVKGLKIDQFISEMAEQRVELDTIDLPISPERVKYFGALDKISNFLKSQPYQSVSQVTQSFRLEYYRLVKRILTEQRQSIPCFAGWASTQIYADGSVWACCIRADSMGNLRGNNYDFRKVWFSQSAGKIRKSIFKGECWCPLANASYTNMMQNGPMVFRVIRRLVGARLKAARQAA